MLCRKVNGQRIGIELSKIFSGSEPARAFGLMSYVGMVQEVFAYYNNKAGGLSSLLHKDRYDHTYDTINSAYDIMQQINSNDKVNGEAKVGSEQAELLLASILVNFNVNLISMYNILNGAAIHTTGNENNDEVYDIVELRSYQLEQQVR